MNRLTPKDAPEAGSAARQMPPTSASAGVYALLANSAADSLGLDHWLAEIAKGLKARLAALVAILDDEPVVQYSFPADSGLLDTVNWPWGPNRPAILDLRKPKPAVPFLSADGHSSFLAATLQHEGMAWVLCVEDAHARSWSVEEQAALTFAASAIFQFAPIQESSQTWLNWSQRAQTQKRLEDIALAVGRLVHDFNNVLASVQGFTELSLGQLPPGSPVRNFVTEVYTAAQQGAQLVQQLSLFSTRRTAAPRGLATSLSFLATEEKNRLGQVWGDAVTLEVRVPADLPTLAIDVDSLRVILVHLLNNARESISGTGTVILSARPVELTREDCLGLLGKASPGSCIEITVADSGSGFSAEARRRIFAQPFFSTKPGHRGLGLAAVYGLLNNHAGGIRLEHGPEKGTLVSVYLPTLQRAVEEALSTGRPAARRPCHAEGGHSVGRPLTLPSSPALGERVGKGESLVATDG